MLQFHPDTPQYTTFSTPQRFYKWEVCFFSKLGFILCKAQQPSLGMELQGAQRFKKQKNLFKNNNSKKVFVNCSLKAF